MRSLTGIKLQIKRLKITLCIDNTLCAPTFAKLNFYCARYCCTNSTNMLFVALKLKPTHYILSSPNLTNNLALSEVVQVFSCEFCGTSKNTFYRTPLGDCFCPASFQTTRKCLIKAMQALTGFQLIVLNHCEVGFSRCISSFSSMS